jgi:molybdate transport repressor ModE-like protein
MDGHVHEKGRQDGDRAGFEDLLRESARMHGHLCAGQVLGARMAVLGLREAGISDPRGADRKSVMVFVEMDRCAADAIQSLTGCTLGKRTLKFLDYGKMAATFVNLQTDKAVRVVARDDSREKVRQHIPGIEDKYEAQIEAYKIMDDRALFEVQNVSVQVRPEDMPGKPLRRTQCSVCREYVQDMREVVRNGEVFCRPCAEGGYYSGQDLFKRSVMQNSHNALEVRSKVWIESDGEPVFGRGRLFLLEAIDTHGSINRAAAEVNISFRKAWSHVKAMEERLGIKLVERHAGGKNGGGAVLTNDAREFLNKYRTIDESVRNVVDNNFRNIFGSGQRS